MVMLDSYQEAARKLREAIRDKSYRQYPMGQQAGSYLRHDGAGSTTTVVATRIGSSTGT